MKVLLTSCFSTLKILATVKHIIAQQKKKNSFSTLKILATVKLFDIEELFLKVLVPLRF